MLVLGWVTAWCKHFKLSVFSCRFHWLGAVSVLFKIEILLIFFAAGQLPPGWTNSPGAGRFGQGWTNFCGNGMIGSGLDNFYGSWKIGIFSLFATFPPKKSVVNRPEPEIAQLLSLQLQSTSFEYKASLSLVSSKFIQKL